MNATSLKLQSLATCNNYYHTGQINKAISVLNQITKIFPDDTISKKILSSIFNSSIPLQDGIFLLSDKPSVENDLSEIFGINWNNESLENKSIMIFCDQGMGDTINLIRYLKFMKDKWNCEVFLNCYSYFDEMADLIKTCKYVDHFVKEYVKTDFHTNIMSVPSILNELDYEFHYPAHFKALLKTEIPNDPYIQVESVNTPLKIGLAWKSNPKNTLGKDKSIELELFKEMNCSFYNLLPEKTDCDFLVQTHPITNLLDTAKVIANLDLVISVDTVVLHLAGAMGKQVWGLLPEHADPRWGDNHETPWYPTMKLYRKTTDWRDLVKTVKEDLNTCLK